MNERDLESIRKFVSDQGADDLFAYFELARDADQGSVEAAIRSRRAWAQGQQANPKYRRTAIWLIKNVALCKRALGNERAAYIAHLNAAAQAEALDILGNVMDGAVFNRLLSVEREDAVLDRGVQLGLPDEVVETFIERYLDKHEARREPPGHFVDLYELLDIPNTATPNDVDAAVARGLAKSQGAGPSATQRRREIRRAARILRSSPLRAEYDHQWKAQSNGAAALGAGGAQQGGSLALQRSDDDESTEVFAPGGLSLKGNAPPPPKSLGGRSLPIGATTGSIRRPSSPRFEILGELQRTVKVGRSPVSIQVTIKSLGDSRLHGRIISDRDWLKVSPDRLDPDRKEQTVTVTIDPSGLTRNRAVALCTVIADRGSRKSVTITAERSSIKPQWIAAVALLGLAGGVAAAWPTISEKLFPPPPPPPPSATLHVVVDPPAGEIHVDGRLIASGGEARGVSGLPLGRPVNVAVILDGFQTWEKAYTLEDGQELTIEPTMILTDPMDFDPDAEAVMGSLDDKATSSAMRGRSKQIQACITEHEPGDDRIERKLEVVAHVLSEGHIASVAFNGKQLPSAGAAHCIKRQLRSVKVPIFQGDYDIAHVSYIVSFPSPDAGKP